MALFPHPNPNPDPHPNPNPNPNQVLFPISAIGSTPVLALDAEKIEFERLLLRRSDYKTLTLYSRSAMPLRWAVRAEDLLEVTPNPHPEPNPKSAVTAALTLAVFAPAALCLIALASTTATATLTTTPHRLRR